MKRFFFRIVLVVGFIPFIAIALVIWLFTGIPLFIQAEKMETFFEDKI